eukprot:m.101794 g.101794  ORF g.101794 m.101794 type:complete len:2172 (-) comp14987_c1_seq1:97-6612(-)
MHRRLSAVRPSPETHIFSGWAEKQGGTFKTWKKRFFVLNDRVLRYSASPEDIKPKGIIVLASVLGIKPVTKPSASFGLEIATPQRIYLLRFTDIASRDLLLVTLKNAVSAAAGAEKPPTPQPYRQQIPQPLQQPQPEAQSSEMIEALQQMLQAQMATSPAAKSKSLPTNTKADAHRDTSMLLTKSRDFGPYIPWTTCGIEDEVMAVLDSIFEHVNLTIIAGPTGSGKSTIVRETFESLRQCHAPQGQAPLSQFRTIALMVCDQCHHVMLLPPSCTAEELLTITLDNGRKARTKSGSCTVVSGAEKCTRCQGAYKLEWTTFPDDECTLLDQLHHQTPDVNDMVLLRCSNCTSSGIPMTPEGICTYVEADQSIIACTGQPMPSAQASTWRFSLPHFGDQLCQSASIDIVPISMDVNTSQAIAARKATATNPQRYRPDKCYYLEILDLGLGSDYMRATPQGITVTMMNKAHKILFSEDMTPSKVCEKSAEECLDTWSHFVSQIAVRASGNVAFFFPRFEQGAVSPEDLARMLLHSPTFKACSFVITLPEDRVAKYVDAMKTHNLQCRVVQTQPKSDTIMAEMLSLYLDGIEPFARPEHEKQDDDKESAPSASDRQLVSNKEIASHVATTLAGQSVLTQVCAANLIRILQQYQPDRVEEQMKQLPTSTQAALDEILDTLSQVFNKQLVTDIVFVLVTSMARPLDLIFEYCQETRPSVTRAEIRRVLQALVGVLAQPRVTANYFPPNNHSQDAALRWVLNQAKSNQRHEWYLRLATVGLREVGLSNVLGITGTIFSCYFSIGAYEQCLTLLRDWRFIHKSLIFAELTTLATAKDVLCQHYQRPETYSPQVIQELNDRWNFILQNTGPLCGADTWSVVQTQYRALKEGDVVRAIMKGLVQPGIEPPSKLVRIFTSSTFDDLKVERNALMARSYPVIRAQLAELGLDFQVVDMRWGIRDESTNDHKTTEICMEEIQQCQERSLGPNFVTLLSQRYGYRPFPVTIDQVELEQLLAACCEADATLLKKWFVLDTNKIPAVYRLLPVTHHLPHFLHAEDPEERRADRSQWWAEFEQMSLALRRAADAVLADDHDKRHKYYFSITEEEIIRGLLNISPEERESQCLWIKRTITDLHEVAERGDDPRTGAFIDLLPNKTVDTDARQLLSSLRDERLPKALPDHTVLEYKIRYAPQAGVDEMDPQHAAYIDTLVSEFTTKMISMVEQNLQIASTKLEADPNIAEVIAHNDHTDTIAKSFFGRQELLNKVKRRLAPNSQAGAPLVLSGPEGSGKSALLAKLAQDLGDGKTAVITRYCGLSAQSSNLGDILRSIVFQVTTAYKKDFVFPENFDELKEQFASLLAVASQKEPLLLIFDGVDRLNSGAANLDTWLPAQLPPYVSVVISVSAHSPDVWSACYKLAGKREENFWEMPNLTVTDTQDIISKTLDQESRTLSPHQMSLLVEACQKNTNALYVRMAIQVTAAWKSQEEPATFPPSSAGILNQLLDTLEVTHGHYLVKHALSYITLSYEGLSASELEDILSLDDDVLNDVFQYWEPPLRRIPPLLMVRLLRDLSQYLTTGASRAGQPCYRWAFSSFALIVLQRYFNVDLQPMLWTLSLENRTEWQDKQEVLSAQRTSLQALLCDTKATEAECIFHERLAEYFSGKWHARDKPYRSKNGQDLSADRLVAGMPRHFRKDVRANGTFASPNSRRALELPFHYFRMNDMDELLAAWAEPDNMPYFAPYFDRCVNLDLLPLTTAYIKALGFDKIAVRLRQRLEELVQDLHEDSEMVDIRYAYVSLTATETMYNFWGSKSAEGWTSSLQEKLVTFMNKVNKVDREASLTASKLAEAESLINEGKVQEGVDKANTILQRILIGSPSLSSVAIILHVARLFLQTGLVKETQQVLQKAYEIAFSAEGQAGAVTQQYEVLKNLANFYRTVGNVQQSAMFMQHALEFAKTHFGESHVHTAVAEHNMGSLYFDLGDLVNAEQHLLHAKTMKAAALGTGHYDNASTMAALAAVYIAQNQMDPSNNRIDEAMSLLQESLELFENGAADSVDAIETKASVLNQLAQCHVALGQFDEGVACMDQAIQECPKNAQGARRLGNLMLNKGVFYMNQNRFLEALPIHLEAHKLMQGLLGPDNVEVGKCAECVAVCLQQCGKLQESMPYIEQVQRISQGAGTLFR